MKPVNTKVNTIPIGEFCVACIENKSPIMTMSWKKTFIGAAFCAMDTPAMMALNAKVKPRNK